MTIHYPTGNHSETSSFRFQMEPPRQIRISFAVGCCTFCRVQTCNAACCICFSSAEESIRFTPKCKGPNGCSDQQNHYFEKYPKQDRFYFFPLVDQREKTGSDFTLNFDTITRIKPPNAALLTQRNGKEEKYTFPGLNCLLAYLQSDACLLAVTAQWWEYLDATTLAMREQDTALLQGSVLPDTQTVTQRIKLAWICLVISNQRK